MPPVRDEESETQRKAHAKRVRETRRSTQGVTLDEIKSAEKLVQKKQQQNSEPPPAQVDHCLVNLKRPISVRLYDFMIQKLPRQMPLTRFFHRCDGGATTSQRRLSLQILCTAGTELAVERNSAKTFSKIIRNHSPQIFELLLSLIKMFVAF